MRVYIASKKNDNYVFENVNYGSIEGAKQELAINPMYIGTNHQIFILDESTGELKDLIAYEQEQKK